nr:MAG TPA: hypothetical protein [Caudoviricetes sp.]
MKDLIITVCADTRKTKFNRGFIGLNGENLQGNIVVDFTDKADFVDGTASFEVEQNGKKYFIEMTKDATNKVYSLPIKSSLLKYAGTLKCQVTITQEETASGTPVFKSEIFQIPCLDAVNATEEIPDQYPTWIETANAKIDEMNALMADMEEKVESGYFNGTDGTDGINGKDALVYTKLTPILSGGSTVTYLNSDFNRKPVKDEKVILFTLGSQYALCTVTKTDLTYATLLVDTVIRTKGTNGTNGKDGKTPTLSINSNGELIATFS